MDFLKVPANILLELFDLTTFFEALEHLPRLLMAFSDVVGIGSLLMKNLWTYLW